MFDDAHLALAVNGVAFASFIASGQTCVSGTRIIIQEKIYDKFMEAFLDKVESIRRRMGDRKFRILDFGRGPVYHPFSASNPQSSMGSVISSKHLERIEQMVQNRKSGEIVAGGERMVGKSALDDFDFSRGSFYPPTVIVGVDTKDEIWQEEVFGPVITVKKFRVSSCPTLPGWLT